MLLPLTYFGSIGYFREFVSNPEVTIEIKEYFLKQTYRNRCNILTANGVISLTIPITKPDGNKTQLDRIEIVDDGWRDIHWRSIRSAYEAAPFFDYYGPEIEELIYFPENNLVRFNLHILKRIIKWLDLPVVPHLSSEFMAYTDNDRRLVLAAKDSFKEELNETYIQTFPGITLHRQNISVLDAILCEGPLARKLLL